MPQISLLNVVDGQVLTQKCTACDLANNTKLKTNCMDGLGKPGAMLMFVGKAPGNEDDGIGKPMTGANGRLFNDLLSSAGFRDGEIFVSNCVKCAPLDAPLKDKHFAACRGHLKLELLNVKPKAVVAVGAEALKWLTGQTGIKKLRRHGLPCLLDDNLLVFPMLQPAQIFHAPDGQKEKLRAEMTEDLRWLRSRMLEGTLGRQDEMPVDYKMATTVEEVYEFLQELTVPYPVSCDVETAETTFEKGQLFPDENGVMTAIGFSKGAGHARTIPIYALGIKTLHYWTDEELELHILPAIKRFLETRVTFGHNYIKFDQKWIRYTFGVHRCNIDFDTQIGHYLLDEERMIGLEDAARIYTNMAPWKSTFQCRDIEKLCQYLARDVDATFQVRVALEKKLDSTLCKLQQEVMIPLSHELMEMELRGTLVNQVALGELKVLLESRLQEEEDEIRKLDGVKAYELEKNTRINLASNNDLSILMGEYLKLPCIEKTSKGAFSTNARVLDQLRDQPFVQHLMQVRGLAKLKGTYCEGLATRLGRDGRIHTNFMPCRTVTGRLASEDPNLQNIPRKETAGRVLEDGKMIKAVFCAGPGNVLIQSDYSQAELRTLAMYSLDPALIAAYRAGQDIHQATAAQVYGVTLDQVTADQRNNAKRVNFGIIYGRTLESIIEQFQEAALKDKRNIGRQPGEVKNEASREAKSFWEGHKRTFPKVWRYMDEQERIIKERGFQETFFGRRRRYDTIDNHAIRQAYNFPIQSTASDFTFIALVRVAKMLREFEIPCVTLLTVHDSIIYECEMGALWDAAEVIKYVMENLDFPFMNVPMVADLEVGLDWGHLKKLNVAERKIG